MGNIKGKKSHRKNYIKYEYLPVNLIKKIQDNIFDNTDLQYRTKNNFLLCVAIIYNYQISNGNGIYNYIPLGRNYWKKIYGGNYHKIVINPLVNFNIIERIDFGYRSFANSNNDLKGKEVGSVGVRYRINPSLLSETCDKIFYLKSKMSVSSSEEALLFNKYAFDQITDIDFRVSINQKLANDWINSHAQLICEEYIKDSYVENTPDDYVVEYRELIRNNGFWTYNRRYHNIKTAKAIAQKNNKELFYYKDSFVVADKKEFINQQTIALKYNYKFHVSKIGALPIEEKISPVTLRLYSSLTNFPSKILQFIQINNSTLVQLDLRTSQFLIFANLINTYLQNGEEFLLSKFKQKRNQFYLKKLINILKKYKNQLPNISVDITNSQSGQYGLSDTTMFIRDIFFNDFYEVVQSELGLKERILAKSLLFKLLFKKSNRIDGVLSKLHHKYPIVMSIIAEFKKVKEEQYKLITVDTDENSESNFSVFLQCIEGEIFIDNILKLSRDKNIPCFTRHDSIVMPIEYQQDVLEIVEGVFKSFNFKANFKIEDKFWEVSDFEELEHSGYIDWLIDETFVSYEIEEVFQLQNHSSNPNKQ